MTPDNFKDKENFLKKDDLINDNQVFNHQSKVRDLLRRK